MTALNLIMLIRHTVMSAPLTNREIANVFHAIADTMEILGEDKFRLQAYRRAGEALADLAEPLASYRARNELGNIPGVGKAITDKIAELLDTGKLEFYEKLRAKIPESVLELLKVQNVGPRLAGRLYSEFQISSIADLQQALDENRFDGVKGFGAKTIAGLKQGVQAASQRDQRVLLFDALRIAEQLIEQLHEQEPSIQRINYAGSLRRGRETIGDLDLLAASDTPSAVIAKFISLPLVASVLSSGDEKASVLLHTGMQADLLAIQPKYWGSALQHFSGSQHHNIRMREMALAQGLSFSEHGFKKLDDQSMIHAASEADVYATIGLPWIPPEIREDSGEFEAAKQGKVPNLVEQSQLQADLHMHSTWSDGKASIREMAQAAIAQGYRYMAITDHSAFLGITNGLDGERLRQQALEVAEINQEFADRGVDFVILRGIEVDILADGSLALPDEVLADLDIVVASPHVSLQQPFEQATERILRAIRNPHVDIIGHPTGRLINQRGGSVFDLQAVGRAAAETGTLLEVNAGPDRLDLDAPSVRQVLELGANITINSDSHHPDNLSWIRLGVITARRGWAETDRVANTWDRERLLAWVSRSAE
jgi:DNA polymerase (family 10)